MADQEEIIIIEESDAAGVEAPKTDDNEPQETKKPINKKMLAIAAGVIGTLMLGGGIAFVLLTGDKEGQDVQEKTSLIPAKNSEEPAIQPSELENMIERANYMYANGNQSEALKLFEKIALYSESISQYNLGVVRLKEKEYPLALENFKRSIGMSENRCVSAINAAVCCLHLKQEADFNYYIDLAQAYLGEQSKSPMYSYYYTLINYYKGNYFEALSALNHPTSQEYLTTQNQIKSSIDTLYGNFDGAIATLENPYEEKDSFALGLLHANNGDLHQAKEYLNSAIIQNTKPIQESLALVFVNLKLGAHQDASTLLKKITTRYPNDVYTPYPITVFLKPALFSPSTIQKAYRTIDGKIHPQTYPKIFFFFPYKIFNANQTISYIQKGTANIFIDDIASAKDYLNKSARSSDVDYGIALCIQKALHFKLRDANKQLKELLVKNPQHSILHYNLALTHAQLGEYTLAYNHFLRSYHLDANNYLAGIFAIMS